MRDAQEWPILYPLFRSYSLFGNIKRNENFPFYITNQAKSAAKFEDRILHFLDWLVDAHELERRKTDIGATQYERTNYVARNFLRYQNDTMANLMFDTKIRQSDMDRLNSVMSFQQLKYYGFTSLFHLSFLAYASYFFRYRRLNKLQVLAVGTTFYYGFGPINNIAYKLFVDKPIIDEAKKMGYGDYVQPNGTFRNRGHNF